MCDAHLQRPLIACYFGHFIAHVHHAEVHCAQVRAQLVHERHVTAQLVERLRYVAIGERRRARVWKY